MDTLSNQSFSLRPHDTFGAWLSDVQRHFESAEQFLTELEDVHRQIVSEYPLPLGEYLSNADEDYPELWVLSRKRDRLSDAVQIFTAMAAEGFLNYYGVVRIGEKEFNVHFERLNVTQKLLMLLLFCDAISLSDKHPIMTVLTKIAQARNLQVHPKTKEFNLSEERPSKPIPGAAREAVVSMYTFFKLFLELVPKAEHLVPPKARTKKY